MKDFLQDIINHTHNLGSVELIKVVGTEKETQISAVAEDKSVIVNGVFKNPIADFMGIFGMPNLNKLKTIIGFDEYDEKARITVSRLEDNTPTNIHFETENNDFINDYRLMSKNIVEEKVKNVSFKGATWNVEFEPNIAGIMRLKKQASANSEESNFTVKTDNNDLKIYFGDHSTHSGNFVFQSDISGSLKRSWMWPVKQFISILDLVGDKKVKISDQGVAQITVDSGIAVYTYLLPAQTK